MKKRNINICLILIGLMFVYACGNSTGGSPGSSGSFKTGITLNVSITSEKHEIDCAIHFCDAAQTEPEAGLFINYATLTIDAQLVNPSYDTFPATVEECTITYLKANEDPASPIIETLTVYPNCTLNADINKCIVALIDIQRKVDYFSDFFDGVNNPAEYPTHYVAAYRCKYYNPFREFGYFEVEYDIWLADWDVC